MLTTDTLRDNPEAYLPRDRRRALATGASLADRVAGSALFADISGFTPLTEALVTELGPQRGAEELTANIGRVFHAVIEELDRQGGDVIYFAGDAITCWIDGDDGTRAAAAALGMQDAIEREGRIVTPGGTPIQLMMKVAIAVGRARRFVVGDPTIQLIDVLAGRLIDDLAEAEHHAERGEIVLDGSAIDALGDRVRLREVRPGEGGGRVGVLDALLVDVAPIAVVEPPPLPEHLVRPWLLPEVYERLRSGRGEFLAELRPAFPVFLKFGGIEYDEDDDAIGKLDDFVQRAQRILAGYGGNILQLTLGDKGAYLYGVFGSPVAHEDDGARAAAAALELRDLDRLTSATDIQVGIGHGRLRSGTYGHAMRRTFVCLGDAVNLAARLMSKAPPGHVYVSDAVRQAAGEVFLWESLPDLTLKGKAAPIVAHALTGSLERASRRRLRFELPLAGRLDELAALEARLEAALSGRGRVVGISAEAGMGKSRLVAEFVRSMRRRGLTVLFGECQSFGTTSGYFVWREIWRRLFELDDDAPAERQMAQLETRLTALDPAAVGRLPLLGPVVGLDIPDSELTAGFDAKLRKASLEDLLVGCLRGAAAADRPLIIVLEDCHWIDELSRSLLEALVRATAGAPVLFTVAYRPAEATGGGLGLERLPSFDEIELGELGREDAAQVIRSKLEQLLGAETDTPESLVELVTERSEGNPFYIEELINFVAGQDVDLGDSASIARLQLPESLHSLVLSRIDTVAEDPRRTLKVASVIGRVFRAPALPEVYPDLGSMDAIRSNLGSLRGADLVRLDREADEAYLFKHVLTQEVAYESMPFAVRASLHRLVGEFIERTEADEIEQQLDLLAFHYGRSDAAGKKVEYLGRAADAARDAYANASAIDYYERLVPLLEGRDRAEALLKLGKVLEFVGQWARAESVGAEALAAAGALEDPGLLGRGETQLAEVARKQGRFDEAIERLGRAEDLLTRAADDAGLGQVHQQAGTVAAQRGDYDAARDRYGRSIVIRERLDDRKNLGSVYSNLAIVDEYGGDYVSARTHNERALAVRTAAGDRWGVGVSLNNLGMIALHERQLDEARDRLEEAIRLQQEVGDRWMLAIARNNLGNATRDLGDAAAAGTEYTAALATYREVDDRWAMAFLLEDIGLLAIRIQRALDGIALLGAAETIRAGIGSPRGEALEEELRAAYEPVHRTLGADVTTAALDRGRALDLEAATELALDVCSRV